MRKNLSNRIEVNPQIMVGKPVIKGTRIPVSVVLNLLGHGYTVGRITKAYPVLTPDDVNAALEYSERIVDKERVFVPERVTHAQVTA